MAEFEWGDWFDSLTDRALDIGEGLILGTEHQPIEQNQATGNVPGDPSTGSPSIIPTGGNSNFNWANPWIVGGGILVIGLAVVAFVD